MTRPEDKLLAAEQFKGMNEEFYRMDPARFLARRLHLLLVQATAPDAISAALAGEVEFKTLKVRFRTDDVDEEAAAADLERFVTLESEVLLHHASETLLRMYFAHESLAACPWLELSRERSFPAFKDKVKRRFLQTSVGEGVVNIKNVFHGFEDAAKRVGDPDTQRWEQGAQNVEMFLRKYAEIFLQYASAYNAAKHGLAVQTGPAGFQLGTADEGSALRRDGPAIEYLEVRQSDHGPRWNRTVRWIDADHSLALVLAATDLLRAIWNIGKWRYLREVPNAIVPFEGLDPRALRSPSNPLLKGVEAQWLEISTMSMELVYYRLDPEVEPPAAT